MKIKKMFAAALAASMLLTHGIVDIRFLHLFFDIDW